MIAAVVQLLAFLLTSLEMQPARLWGMRRQIFGLGLAQVLACTLLLTGVGVVTGFPVVLSFVAGAGFVLTSTAIVMQLLEERGEMTTPPGQQMVSAAECAGESQPARLDAATIPATTSNRPVAITAPSSHSVGSGPVGTTVQTTMNAAKTSRSTPHTLGLPAEPGDGDQVLDRQRRLAIPVGELLENEVDLVVLGGR